MNDISPFVLQFLNSTISFTSIDFSTQNQLFHGSESTVLVSKANIATTSPEHLVMSNSATFSFRLCRFSIESPNSVTTGLLKTEDNWSGLQVISSRLTNVTMSHESCLTGDALTRSVGMISSQVLNLSTTTPTTAFSSAPSISAHGTSSVVGSDWVDTSNAFYGHIVGDLNSETEIISVNNTHTRSLRMGWYSASNKVYTAKQNITSSKTFNGDTFTGCSPPALDLNNEGGAMYIAASGIKVNLTSCTFTNCRASQGGAIRVRVDYTMTMIIDKCTFNSCYCTDQTGVYRSHNCGTDTITNCKFNNCSHPTGGTLFFIYASKVRVAGCTFTECKATTGSYSVVETFATSYLKDLLFSNTSIIKCSTKLSAHMYFVANCQFQSLVFHQCTTGSTDYGDVRGGAKHKDLPSYSTNHMPHFTITSQFTPKSPTSHIWLSSPLPNPYHPLHTSSRLGTL
ncbi:hypothetical protein BLNAU_16738 [Blattamonas nauphoetae]|uniref:Right handed beta helix domain-containing protein n=1 Tax=Blattamonas nauphoetae TaxID=2049346 RepID=A0ABQ9X9C1_9EUKA|nr:hypothetical protein BLNAU_16738 [Blattamonas nauphoetae]